MKLNRTPNPLDRNARNGENDNWDKIEGAVKDVKNVVDDFIGTVSDEVINELIDNAQLNWKEFVDSYEDLPTDAQNGDTVLTRDDGKVYRFDGSEWVVIQQIDINAINEIEQRLDDKFTQKYEDVKTQLAETETKATDAFDNVRLSNYYQEVEVTRHYDSASNTHYHLTTIKHKDGDGKIIKLKHETMRTNNKTIREFAVENNATVATNASWIVGQQQFSGVTIKNGEVQPYTELTPDMLEYRYILGIKEDNTMVSYHGSTPITQLQNEGIIDAVTPFIPLIQNGSSVNDSLLNVFHMGEKHPRQAIAQFANKDIMFITTGGRGFDGDGMTASDVVRILLNQGVTFAHMLDGGGSASTVVRGVQINRPTDSRGTEERRHAHALYIAKPRTNLDRDRDIEQINKELGILNNKIDGKSERYVTFNGDIEALMNNWEGTLYVRMTDVAFVHIYGSIVVGTKGVTQTIVAQLDDRFKPIVDVTGTFTEANSPWTTYTGFVVSNDGYVRLRGNGNSVATGTRIHVNMLYKTSY